MSATILAVLAVLFGGTTAYLLLNRKKSITQDDAAKAVKSFAEKNKVSIELSEDQMNKIIQSFNQDPKEAARLTFFVEGKAKAEFNVAAYYYRGDTCCV